MAKVVRREGEEIDALLKRFKRKVNDELILADIKKFEFYRSKSQKRKEKRDAAEARRRKFERNQRMRTLRMQQISNRHYSKD